MKIGFYKWTGSRFLILIPTISVITDCFSESKKFRRKGLKIELRFWSGAVGISLVTKEEKKGPIIKTINYRDL